jgi:nickel-dependent lactate racemase
MAYIKLMEYEWSDNPHEVDYYLPDSWDVTVYHIAGYQKPALSVEQISTAVASPTGSRRIRDLARGKKKVCILFDDMTRGTPTSKIIPSVLAELKEGGMTEDRIEFICALGAHQAWDRSVLARKVGDDIMEKFPVFNHATFMNCTPLGKTSFGTRVEVNTEVMSCDLKLAISNIVPHPSYGFGGGGKIVMPGVSSYESIYEHHAVIHRGQRQLLTKTPDAKGVFDGNTQPPDAMEFARMAGMDFSINCLLNERAEVVGIFAGDIGEAHKLAVSAAKEHYRVPDVRDNDIAISNAFCKADEATIATAAAFIAVKRTGGTAVTIANSHLGQIAHYLNGAWGMSTGGRNMGAVAVPTWIDHCVFYSEFPEGRNWTRWSKKDLPKVLQPNNWTEVVSRLIEWHGFKAKVAVFPDGTNQYTPQPEYEGLLQPSEEMVKSP